MQGVSGWCWSEFIYINKSIKGSINGDTVPELGRVAGKCGHSSEDEMIELMEQKAGKASKRGKEWVLGEQIMSPGRIP